MQRSFEATHGPTGRLRVLVRCSDCGETEDLSQANQRRLPAQVIAKRMAARGWAVHEKKEGRDLCPKCQKTLKLKPKDDAPMTFKAEPTMLPFPSNPAPKADTPRAMTYDERRLIFAKLNEVYIDDKRGYDVAWSDERVAKDLGIPRSYVKEIREQNFGPVQENTEVQEFIKDVAALQEKILGVSSELKQLSDKLAHANDALNAVVRANNSLLKTSDELRRAAGLK